MDLIFNGRSRNAQIRPPDDRTMSRAETLAASRAKRAQREAEQKRLSSACLIQRHYRGYAGRKHAAARLAEAVAAPDATLQRCGAVYGYFKRLSGGGQRANGSKGSTLRSSASVGAPALLPARGLWAWFATSAAIAELEASFIRALARSSDADIAQAHLSLSALSAFAHALNVKVDATPEIVAGLIAAALKLSMHVERVRALLELLHVLEEDADASAAAGGDPGSVIMATRRALTQVAVTVVNSPPSDMAMVARPLFGRRPLVTLQDAIAASSPPTSPPAAAASSTAAGDRMTSRPTARTAAQLCDFTFGPEWPDVVREAGVPEAQFQAAVVRSLLDGMSEQTTSKEAQQQQQQQPSQASVGHTLRNVLEFHDVVAAATPDFGTALVALMRATWADTTTGCGATLFGDLLEACQRSLSSAAFAPVWLLFGGVESLLAQFRLPDGPAGSSSSDDRLATDAGRHTLLAGLDSVCDALLRPYTAFIAGHFRATNLSAGAFTTRRAQAVPYVSTLAHHPARVIATLWGVLKQTTSVWALKNSSGALVLRYANIICLFAHLSSVYLATSDLVAFADMIGGPQELRRLVLVLRDMVFLAVWNGEPASSIAADGAMVAADASARRATAAFLAGAVKVLEMIHTADAATSLVRPHEWVAPSIILPRNELVTLDSYYGPETTAAIAWIQNAATMDATGAGRNEDSSSSSDSDDDDTALRREVANSRRAGAAPRQSANTGDGASSDGTATTSIVVRLMALLRTVPFLVPFAARVEIFSHLLYEERRRSRHDMGGGSLRVRRGHEFEDAFAAQYQNPRAIIHTYDVRFEDETGRHEMGYGQGVLRDFLFAAAQGGFKPENGLFAEDPATKTLHVLPFADPVPEEGDARPRFAYLGRLLGRAIRDGILVDVPLPRYLRNALLGRQNSFADLDSYDPGLQKHLQELKQGKYDDEELWAMELTFTYTEQHNGQVLEVPLIAGGESVTVNSSNVLQYCHLMTDYLLNRRSARNLRALQEGLFEVVSRERFNIFDSDELQRLISGQESDVPLDVDDWMKHTEYQGWEPHSPAVAVFWAAVREMSPSEQRSILKFATSAGRAPLLGFSQLHPPFTLVRSSESEAHLPTAATCMCVMRVPAYSSVATAKAKLLQAASQCNTFEMS